jgi:polyisoprenyl-teichoic acid--peptidoglycan teichoic acid transferase
MARLRRIKHPKTIPPQPPRFSSYSPGQDRTPEPGPQLDKPRKSFWTHLTRFLVIGIFVIFIAGILLAVWDARNLSAATQKLFGSGNILELLNSISLKQDSNGRVNVLVAGNSADDPGHAGAALTDSILLLSMDPIKHTGYMLSIPRDLYVSIPGQGYGKINEAYPDSGMPLLQQTVEKILGIQIDYSVLVGYTAVKQITDAIGGIDVTIKSPDGKLYDPNKDWTTNGPLVDLSNGMHHLNGEQALDLTRARGDPSQYGYPIGFEQADFQRTADQRMIFTALKSKMNWKLVLNPLTNGKILSAVSANLKTNLNIDEARPLFGLFNRIPSSQLQSLSLRDLNGRNYLSSYVTPYGQSALVPAAGLNDYSDIISAISALN